MQGFGFGTGMRENRSLLPKQGYQPAPFLNVAAAKSTWIKSEMSETKILT